MRAVMDDVRENLSWQTFGEASRELAMVIAADRFEPDLILSIARGGLFLAASLGYALGVKNLHVMNVEFYVWKRTDRWINFPWSCDSPVVQRAGQVLDA
jgi:hypoxanthine phosphoribosyltransferase